MTSAQRRTRFAVLLTGALLGAAAADAQERRATPPPGGPSDRAVLELLTEIEQLQSLVRELRGELEVQRHRLEQVQDQQRQALADFDRRLRALEQGVATRQAQEPAADTTRRVIVTPPVGADDSRPSAAPAARAEPPTDSEQQAYDAAFDLMKQGRYDQAADRFRKFIERFPNGALTDNAQYWIGEAAYVMRDLRTALDEFDKVLADYPDSPKVPDALLKIGYTYYELGEYEKARETLSEVMARYPNTTVAKSAELRVEQIAREGH